MVDFDASLSRIGQELGAIAYSMSNALALLFFFLFVKIILLLYWGYIVTFIKVLTIYHS
jgi:hypothetical protein